MHVSYNVCGSIKSIDDTIRLKISGNIIIDNILRKWAQSSSSPADPAPSGLENIQYSYFIPEYTLVIYSFADSSSSSSNIIYSFSGTAGSLYMEKVQGGTMGDLMWFLVNGTGNWIEWTGEHFLFYKDDLLEYDLYNDIHELAPIIRLTHLDYTQNDPILISPIKTDILLTRIGEVAQDETKISPPTGIKIK